MDPASATGQLDAPIGDSRVCAATASAAGGQGYHPVMRRIDQRLIKPDSNLSDRDSRSFLPQSELTEILGANTVHGILDSVRTTAGCRHDPIDANKDICGEGRHHQRIKIFAVLMFIDRPCYIASFVRSDIWDDQLPLDAKSHEDCFEGWDYHDIWTFCKWQYKVLAPVFDFTTPLHCKYSFRHHMPFLDALDFKDSGAHGSVSKIRIHQDHQIWESQAERREFYAIKHFHRNDNDTFGKEREALARFSRPNGTHENLIELLFSYEVGSDQYMVFPWADCNLQEFWRKSKSQPSEQGDLIWLIRQCRGLADGLCEVHRYHGPDDDSGDDLESETLGRHGDIKPKNILFFASQSERGRLVIADFTLMRFHAPNTEHTDAKDVKFFSRTYRPPELECKDGISVSQKYDIWTLGCVFLEFITWHHVGYDAIYERCFRESNGVDYASFNEVRVRDDDEPHGHPDDKFFNHDESIQNEPKATVKDSVRQWVDFLKQHPNASPASRAFLMFILGRMMVISPDNRCSMKTVRRKLEKLHDERHNSDFYLPGPSSQFPPIFTESDRYRRPAAGNLSYYSLPDLSNSSTDQRAFEGMNLPSRGGSVQPQDNQENPKPSLQAQNMVAGGPDNDEQQNSQTSEGSTGETRKSLGANRTVEYGQNRTRGRLLRLVGRLVPSSIRNRLLVTRSKADTLNSEG